VVPIETEHTRVATMGIFLGSLRRCGSSASEIACRETRYRSIRMVDNNMTGNPVLISFLCAHDSDRMLRRRNCEVKSYVAWAFFSYHGGPRDASVAHLGLRNGRHLAPTSYRREDIQEGARRCPRVASRCTAQNDRWAAGAVPDQTGEQYRRTKFPSNPPRMTQRSPKKMGCKVLDRASHGTHL